MYRNQEVLAPLCIMSNTTFDTEQFALKENGVKKKKNVCVKERREKTKVKFTRKLLRVLAHSGCVIMTSRQ